MRGADSKSRSKLIEGDDFDESAKGVLRDTVFASARDAQPGSRRATAMKYPFGAYRVVTCA